MSSALYDTLASVYDWLVPEPLLTPHGQLAEFADVLAGLAPASRVLDCAAGTGQLAVGLALSGFDVVASDASTAMLRRTRELAAQHGVALQTRHCEWETLDQQSWDRQFDAVF